MKITFAQFNVETKGKAYAVRFAPQFVADNVTSFVVEISDAGGGVLDSFSSSGRQSISPWNAKEIVRAYLVKQGAAKPRKGSAESPLKSKAGDPPNEFGVYQYADQEIKLEPLKSNKASAKIQTLELENGKFISSCSFYVDGYSGSGLSIHGKQHDTRGAAIVEQTTRIRKSDGMRGNGKEARRLRKFIDEIEASIVSYDAAAPERIYLYQLSDDMDAELDAQEAQIQEGGDEPKAVSREGRKARKMTQENSAIAAGLETLLSQEPAQEAQGEAYEAELPSLDDL
jgi:hypothetical protein